MEDASAAENPGMIMKHSGLYRGVLMSNYLNSVGVSFECAL